MAKVYGCDLSKIGRFGKTLDFYYWKGILCVRMYPKKITQPGTQSQMETWQAMRYANAEYSRLAQQERDAFSFLSNPSQMSGRDLFLKTVLEGYRERGESLCRITIRTEPVSEDSVRIRLTKSVNAPVLLACITPQDKDRYLRWREISPILRGKRFMRRWDLDDNTEHGTAVFYVSENNPTFETIVFEESGIKYATARVELQPGMGFGRAGLYHVFA